MQKTAPSFNLQAFNRDVLKKRLAQVDWQPLGRVCDVVGTVIEAVLPGSQVGTIVAINVPSQQGELLAEVAGFRNERALLIPYGSLNGVSPGCTVSSRRVFNHVPVGDFLLGRVVDPMLQPLFGPPLALPQGFESAPLEKSAPNPMERRRVDKPFCLGVRSIDGLLTFGEGQRIGIMAGSGVGKSVLLGMMARGSEADVNVIGLIGERGREVREFIERDLGERGLAKSVVVVVTGDQSPLLRIRGAKVATAIAEHFSREGKKVLLMMDSLTRVAMAQREIGLAVGEPPTTKGYPPSVFALLPRLLERSGPQCRGHGSISALYTVLVDGDDFNDPIPDAVRSVLDGHINLSRDLAAKGHFPAIDVTTSASRVMFDIVSREHWEDANKMKSLVGVYQENFDYVQLGSYVSGTNPLLDQAIEKMPSIEAYLRQDMRLLTSLEQATDGLGKMFQGNLRFDEPLDEDQLAV